MVLVVVGPFGDDAKICACLESTLVIPAATVVGVEFYVIASIFDVEYIAGAISKSLTM